MTLIQELTMLAAPWQSAYNDSKLISTAVTTMHLVALLFGGGFAVAADRMTLRAGRDHAAVRPMQLAELHAVHRPVLAALALLFGSGMLLAAADVETYATSPAFWLKLGLVALLVVNGGVLTVTERALRRAGDDAVAREEVLWRRLRWSAVASIALWTATLVAGAVLVNA